MLWKVRSINNFNLQLPDYDAMLLVEDNPFILPTVDIGIVESGEEAPKISGIVRKADQIVITVFVGKKNTATLVKNMTNAFNNLGADEIPLVVEEAITQTQWSLQVKPVNIGRHKGYVFKLIATVADRLWRKTITPTVWNITSSPSLQTIVNSGNQKVPPTFIYQPTAAKLDGFKYQYWVPIKNPGDQTFNKWGLDLFNGGFDTRTWIADATKSNQLNGGIAAGTLTFNVDTAVGGGLETGNGMMMVDSEQVYYTSIIAGVVNVYNSGGVTGRGWGGTTAASHADNAVCKQSYMRADGNDLRFFFGAQEQNLWLVRPNQVNSQAWIDANLTPRVEIKLKTAIASVGSITQIAFEATAATDTALNKLPAQGLLLLDNEAFLYTSKDKTKRVVKGISRAARNTSMAAHSAGITCYWIQWDNAWLVSGSPFLSARVNDDTLKPMFDITTSTNASRVYTEFGTVLGLRAQEWKRTVVSSTYPADGGSTTYTGNHQDIAADPFTDAGMRMKSIWKNSKWNAENGKIEWSIQDPAGIVTVDIDVEKYRVGTAWPAICKLQKSKNGTTYEDQLAFASPASASTWTADTPSVQNFGAGYYYAKLRLEGTITAGGGSGGVNPNEADIEMDSLTYTTAAPPVVAVYARNTGLVEVNFQVTNNANGTYFQVNFTMKINSTLTIDCGERTLIYSEDGRKYRSAIYVTEEQANWMDYEIGNNELQYEEANVTGVQITCIHEDLLAG